MKSRTLFLLGVVLALAGANAFLTTRIAAEEEPCGDECPPFQRCQWYKTHDGTCYQGCDVWIFTNCGGDVCAPGFGCPPWWPP
jgi:hypothetical protein